QELQGPGIEEDLQEAHVDAEHLALRELLVLGLSDLVRDPSRRQLLLGRADHRDLRNRVDPVGRNSRRLAPGFPNMWQLARRPCSMEVDAREGNPMTSPAA